ncbi:laccase domain-containing protein, partial [bacterium]
MAWLYNGSYCQEEYLNLHSVPHCITTKKAGNIRNEKHRLEFFGFLSKERVFKHDFSSKQIFYGEQVHGNNCSIAEKGKNNPKFNLVPLADGLYTNDSECLIGVFTADCLPLFILDTDKKCTALVHAGWRSAKD